MDRRQFLKLSGLGALALASPLVGRDGRAAVPAYGGPFWVLVHAQGAWDPRFAMDPIGPGDQNRYFSAIGNAGNIQFADWAVDITAFGLDPLLGYEAYLLSNRTFFETHGFRFTVINGIDTSTNNHDAGTREIWSGVLLGEYPAFGALVAAARAADQPMAFISAGSYDVTDGLVPLARAGSPNTLAKIAFPNSIDPTDPASDHFHTDETVARIRAARVARLDAQKTASRLPREQSAMDALGRARASSLELSRLTLPAALTDLPGYQLDDLERMMQGAQIAVAAFKSGVAAAATLSLGGFDTHGNHDQGQPLQLAKLWKGIDFLIAEADAAGVLGQLYIVVASDFGRGPTYNSEYDSAGKDHWPITSMLVAGPGIAGNRVIGATDGAFNARPIDPASLSPADNGVILTPQIVHVALRHLAGIDEFASSYPIDAPSLPLFG